MLPMAMLSGVRKLWLWEAEEVPESGSRDDPDPLELSDMPCIVVAETQK